MSNASVSPLEPWPAEFLEIVDGGENMARVSPIGVHCGRILALGVRNMASFVFHMEGHADVPERVRMRLEDPVEARAHAVVAVGDLLRNAGAGFWNGPEWQIEVTDETGRTICTLTIQGQAADMAQADRTRVAARVQPAMAVVA